MFGTITNIKLIKNKNGNSRGYAFIVFDRERDMKGSYCTNARATDSNTPLVAYKEGEHMQILGKRILVDVERGRTVRGWKPRRLGGGLGGRPKKEPEVFGRGGGMGAPSGGGMRGGGFGGGGGRGGGFGDRGGFR